MFLKLAALALAVAVVGLPLNDVAWYVLLAVAADDESSALSAYDALVPLDSLGAAAAGDLIAAAFAGEDGGARLANRPAGGAETYAAHATSQTAGVPAEVEVVVPRYTINIESGHGGG